MSVQERIAIGVDETEPYSKAIRAGGFVHVKSQIGTDPDTKQIPADVGNQTRLTLANIAKALDAAGSSAAALVKLNVYLAHIDDDFDAMGEAYDAFFREREIVETPARTTVGVPLSWPQLRVQIDAVAVAP
jgi:2-iminobutanoate/2-iminopropanoate deaminase